MVLLLPMMSQASAYLGCHFPTPALAPALPVPAPDPAPAISVIPRHGAAPWGGQVAGIVETNRPDVKNAQYQECIKTGDHLLNRLQKLGQVINI